MRYFQFLVGLLVFAGLSSAQHGTADNGYYPAGYHGDTWTGTVLSADQKTGEITLSCTKAGKTETFVGVPEAGYLVRERNGSVVATRPLRMTDIPIGKTIKVWYSPQTQKVDGSKVKVNSIFLIDIVGNVKPGQAYFKSFN